MKDPICKESYKEIAPEYAARISTKPHNAYYEQPALRSLIPDVMGKTILDVGCGTGVQTRYLVDNGARVMGLDASPEMLSYAKKDLGNQAEFSLVNIEEDLSFLGRETYDGIVSALTITYIENLDKLFKQLRNLLKTGGWFVFSTEHPLYSFQYYQLENYFKTQKVERMWGGLGKKILMKSYHHSMGCVMDALLNNGFCIEKFLEPLPTDEFREKDPKTYDELCKSPVFMCFRARRF